MPQSFNVPNVARLAKPHNKFGSIADHPFIPKIVVGNGKNSIGVNVRLCGGLGAAIAPPLNWRTKSESFLPLNFLNRLKSEIVKVWVFCGNP
jgi:hypothetical protein